MEQKMVGGFRRLVEKSAPYRKISEHFERRLRPVIEAQLRSEIEPQLRERIRDRQRSRLFEKTVKPLIDYGHISFRESDFLMSLAENLETDGPIVEIGTLFGWSTKIIALGKSHERALITVDNFVWNPSRLTRDEHIELARIALQKLVENENVEMIVADKGEFYRNYSGVKPSMVFLDADHSYEETLKDIDWALSVNAPVICGHDYSREHPGVMQAVEERGGYRQIVDSLWLLNST